MLFPKTKLGESDDIEAFLTTFERMIVAYGVDMAQWVYRLAPQSTGRAQQAYAATVRDTENLTFSEEFSG